MSTIKKQQIVDAMVTRFEGIGGGLYYNTFKTVTQWRVTPWDILELPALNIRDTIDSVLDSTRDGSTSLPTMHELTVEIDIVCADGETTIDTVRELIADVERAIKVDETWGGIAVRTQPLSAEISSDQERTKVGGAVLTVRVDYRTNKFSES